jgi:ketosteroid isomerase-like protein
MAEPLTPEQVVEAMFAATDARDVEAKLELVTDDVILRFGNREPMVGKAALRSASEEFNASVRGIVHEITGLWRVVGGKDENLVLTELQVRYERLDGRLLTLPCFNEFGVRDGLICDYQIFMDMSPVYA